MTKNVYRFFVPTANQANLWGLIDDQGKLILKPNYAWINEFDEGYQWPVNVQNREGKWGYVAADGSIVHEIELEQAQAFSKDGFARFKKNEKWGFIRADGSYLVSPSYDDASYFSNGYAAVKQEDAWHYIDTQGKRVSDESFFYADAFAKAGFAIVAKEENSKFGFIDTQSQWLVKPQFDSAQRSFDSGNTLVKLDDQWGVVDSSGKWLVKPKYESISRIDETGFAKVTIKDYREGGIINDQGEMVLNMGSKDVDWLSFNSRCGIANFFDYYYGKVTYFRLNNGQAIDALNSANYRLAGRFNNDCISIALTEKGRQWIRLNANGEQFKFDAEVLEPFFDQSTGTTSFAHDGGFFAPVLTHDRSLAYVDYQGKIALKTEVLKQDTQDVLIVRDAKDNELWRQAYEPNTLIENTQHLAFLNLGNTELGYQAPERASLEAQIKTLKDTAPTPFDSTGYELDDSEGDGFGAGIRLASAWYKYFDHAYSYYTVFDRANLTSRFNDYKTELISIYGEPLEIDDEIEKVLDENYLYAYNQEVWRVDGDYLVLHESQYEDGDVDYFSLLNLLLIPSSEARRSLNNIPLVGSQTVNIADSSSKSVSDALELMENEMQFSTPIELRLATVNVLNLLKADEAVSAHDYLRTQHALIHAAYYDSAEELQIGTTEQFVSLSENVMQFIEKQGLETDLLTAQGQFRRDLYRRAANGSAWLLKESDPEKALSIIEPAMPIVNDRDSFIYDTYARVLLELDKNALAYAVIKKVLDTNPWYDYFQEFYDDRDYKKWLKQTGAKLSATAESPTTTTSVSEKQDIAIHGPSNRLAIAWFDEIHLVDLLSGETLHRNDMKTYDPFTLKFSVNGNQLVSSGWDVTNIWDAATGKNLRRQRVPDGNSEHAGVSGSGSEFYYDNEGYFYLKSIKSGSTKLSINNTGNANASADGNFLAIALTGKEDDELAIIDLKAAKIIANLTGEEASPYDNELFFVDQNRRLIVRDYSNFHLWNIAESKLERTWSTDDFDVDEIAVLDDQLIIFDGDAFQKRSWKFAGEPSENIDLAIPSIAQGGVSSVSVSANKRYYALVTHNTDLNLSYVFVMDMNNDAVLAQYISPTMFGSAEFVNGDSNLVLDGYPIEVVDWANNKKIYQFSR